jgi:hypothetical protein
MVWLGCVWPSGPPCHAQHGKVSTESKGSQGSKGYITIFSKAYIAIITAAECCCTRFQFRLTRSVKATAQHDVHGEAAYTLLPTHFSPLPDKSRRRVTHASKPTGRRGDVIHPLRLCAATGDHMFFPCGPSRCPSWNEKHGHVTQAVGQLIQSRLCL